MTLLEPSIDETPTENFPYAMHKYIIALLLQLHLSNA